MELTFVFSSKIIIRPTSGEASTQQPPSQGSGWPSILLRHLVRLLLHLPGPLINEIEMRSDSDYDEPMASPRDSMKRSGQRKGSAAKRERGKAVIQSTTGWRNGRNGQNWALSNVSQGLNRRGVASKETGYVDLASSGYALDTTGSVTLIATVAQGASVNQRIGKKAIWKSLQCRGQAYNGPTAQFNDCAVLIVYDKRPTGALPAVTDVLVTANSGAMNNDVNSGRFRILKRIDWMMIGNPTGTIATQQLTECTAKSFDFYLKLRGLQAVFKAAGTGAIGDIEEGALYLVTVGASAAGTGAATLAVGFRTRFIDT